MELVHEILGELRYVGPARVEARNLHGIHVQSIIQILEKPTFRNLLFHILRRGGDHAKIDANHVFVAYPVKLSANQRFQQLGLQVHRQIFDLVEKYRSSMSLLKHSGSSDRSVFAIPEQRPLEFVFFHGARNHVHERFLRPRRLGMNVSSGMFLATSRRPVDQNASVASRHAIQRIPDFVCNLGGPDDFACDAAAQAKRSVFAPQPDGLHRAPDHGDEKVGSNWFLYEVVRAHPHRAGHDFNASVGGDDDDRYIGIVFLQFLHDPKAIQIRVFQPQVKQDEAWKILVDCLEAFFAIRRGSRAVTAFFQQFRKQPQDILVVVDNKDIVA